MFPAVIGWPAVTSPITGTKYCLAEESPPVIPLLAVLWHPAVLPFFQLLQVAVQ